MEMNVLTAPKTGTFQMRINPEIKQRVEQVFANYGLTLTDAVNVFIQQSLNANGMPFLLSPENSEYIRAQAIAQLMSELQKGLDSVKTESDWITESELEAKLGITK